MVISKPSSSLTPATWKRRKRATRIEIQKSQHRRPVFIPRGGLSKLELLPEELLEHIYFYLCTPSLARASPYIAFKLSSARVYRKTCRLLFGEEFYVTATKHGELYAKNLAEMNVEELTAGTRDFAEERLATFSCKWLTGEVFRDAQLEVSKSIEEEHRRQLEKVEEHMVQPELRSRLWLGPANFIPRKLVRWPVSSSRRQLLDVLLYAGCIVKPASVASEEANDCLTAAFKANDYRMAWRLLEGIVKDPSMSDIEALQDGRWNSKMIWLVDEIYEHQTVYKRPTETLRVLYRQVRFRNLAYRGRRGTLSRSDEDHICSMQDTYITWGGCPCFAMTRTCVFCNHDPGSPSPRPSAWHELDEVNAFIESRKTTV